MPLSSSAKRASVFLLTTVVLAVPLSAVAREAPSGPDVKSASRVVSDEGSGAAADANAADDDASPSPAGTCRAIETCCRVCSSGKACGKSCIQANKACRKGRGCACDADEVCN